MTDYERLMRRFERERAARRKAEAILAEKSRELYDRSEELRRLNLSLEEKIQQRTQELQQARDDALVAAEAKARFLAHMSHEIRTPLNGVLGTLEMLSETRLDRQQRSMLATARRSGEHLLGVINDVLDFSKIEAGKMQLAPESVDLRELLDDIVASLRVLASKKKLSLRLVTDPEVAERFELDPLRVRQVVTNLIANAIKFTEQGGVTVALTSTSNGCDIAVSDTGIGMPEDVRSTIFESFAQADKTTARRFGGTGLGLTITRDLVRLMGGSIDVSSEPDRGSTFTVSLPLASSASTTADAMPQLPKRLGNYSVLVVDDNPVNQMITRHLIRKLGLQVEVAGSGQDALDVIAMDVWRFDLVLMDLQMPGMDGFEATRRIRQMHPALLDLPIVAMTAHATEADRIASMKHGLDEHLTKPIDASRLGLVIEQLLGNEQPPPRQANVRLDSRQVLSRLIDMHASLGHDLLQVEEIAHELSQVLVPEVDQAMVSQICRLVEDYDLDELELQLKRHIRSSGGDSNN